MSEGYSGTPLAKKLGVKDGQRTWRHGMPGTVAAEIADAGMVPIVLGSPEPGLEMAHGSSPAEPSSTSCSRG
jgi:hypothetical protein